MIRYKIYQNQQKKGLNAGKWFARAVSDETFDLAKLAEHMSKHNSPYSGGVIKGVLSDMVDCIKELLLDGKCVKIDDLAIFGVGIRSKAADTLEECSLEKNISGMRLKARATGNLSTNNLKLDSQLKQQAEYQKRRREGFRKGMKQHFPEAPETVFTLSPEQGKQAFQRSMDQILKKITGGGYDGILCDSDITAIELLQSAQTAGLKVPEAFSLIGYGNLGISSLMRPALTTLSQNFEEIGSMTTRFVIDAVRNGQSAEQERNLLLPVKLIIRDSTQKT